jgi:hypothetical protein
VNLDGYEQQQSLALSGLQLDEVDVPRRGASRANSVRFDDSATTNHWIHDSPGTSDYFQVAQRPSNSIGGYEMTERSSSHKSDNRSDGRQSLRFFGDGFLSYDGETGIFRPQTQDSDALDSCLHRSAIPKMGPTPAVIRCWLDVASSFDPLLYAVVCTGSARSAIEMSLVTHLRLQDRVSQTSEGDKIEVSVYLPDAIMQQHSRITGPSKLPRLTVEFMVLPVPQPKSKDGETIRIFIGSDVIASHMGDILFSQSKILLHVDGRKVFVPFIRPDAEDSLSDIFTAHSRYYTPKECVPQECKVDIGNNRAKAADSGMESADSRRTQLSVSSPRPIYAGHASVIRGVAAMEPDFTAKEHPHVPATTAQQGEDSYQTIDTGRPWTASGDSRKPSFGAESLRNFSPQRDTSSSPFEEKMEAEAPPRGRSLTNPYEDSHVTVAKSQQGIKVWEGTRKTSMTYSAPLKESNGSSTASGVGSYSRGSSRGMKVLRTSKSFSSSSDKANPHPNIGAESSASAGHARNTFKPAANRGHNRTMSGGDAVHSPQNPKGSLVRAKSSNVVGGATAFHWMTPKSTVGGE